MADILERVISDSGTVFGIACDTTEIVGEARRRHDLGPTAAAALGRSLTGAILLAGLLKEDQEIQLIFEGNGPLEKVIAHAGHGGWCRGYVQSPHAEVPLRNGLIDVAAGIGRAGFLRVIKDIGMKEKYTGLVRLHTSEVGEDIAYYLTESEQTPSVISLGVHFRPDGTVIGAGGYLLQTLPPGDEEVLKSIEQQTRRHSSVTSLLAQGYSPKEMLGLLFQEVAHRHTGSTALRFACRCTRERMEQVLATLAKDDILYLLGENDGVDVQCDYCGDNYHFSRDYLQTVAARKTLH